MLQSIRMLQNKIAFVSSVRCHRQEEHLGQDCTAVYKHRMTDTRRLLINRRSLADSMGVSEEMAAKKRISLQTSCCVCLRPCMRVRLCL